LASAFDFSSNVEVGRQTIFSELRTLIAFLEIAIPDPRSLLSVISYNELTGISTQLHKK
jgi:hypothetical protein